MQLIVLEKPHWFKTIKTGFNESGWITPNCNHYGFRLASIKHLVSSIMGKKQKTTIGVVTCARSDYGIYLPILKKIRAHSQFDLRLYVTGMHLSPEFGLTVSMCAKDGFAIYERIEMLLSSDTPEGIAKSMGLGTIGFAQSFSRSKPDILLLMGDRFEMHTAAVSSLPFKIPIAHIHGGEATSGLIDESIRHSITKMSHLHFPSTDEYAQRILQMGEEKWRITVVGAPGLDNLRELSLLSKSETARMFNFDHSKPVLLVTFHPVTLEFENTEKYINNLLCALQKVNTQLIFTYPNADTAGRIIIKHIQEFCQHHQEASLVVNATQKGYFSLLASVNGMVGNSSSGIIEAASFKLPVVNIGTRQHGRIHANNVINCNYSVSNIKNSILRALTPDFQSSLQNLINPYGDGQASGRIIEHLEKSNINQSLLFKQFEKFPTELTT